MKLNGNWMHLHLAVVKMDRHLTFSCLVIKIVNLLENSLEKHLLPHTIPIPEWLLLVNTQLSLKQLRMKSELRDCF